MDSENSAPRSTADSIRSDRITSDRITSDRMRGLIQHWETTADAKATFLRCYFLMTNNMLSVIQQGDFLDPAWVASLLDCFAGYYFDALEQYEQDPVSAPRVWRLAHDAAREPGMTALQNLLLGVNAHINYDLAFALSDVLRPEWHILAEEQRARRYQDYCHVNDVIGQTIDAAQDQILSPSMPVMGFIDKLFGSLDEMLISRLITEWREKVWLHATHLLDSTSMEEQLHLRSHIEKEALELDELLWPKSVFLLAAQRFHPEAQSQLHGNTSEA